MFIICYVLLWLNYVVSFVEQTKETSVFRKGSYDIIVVSGVLVTQNEVYVPHKNGNVKFHLSDLCNTRITRYIVIAMVLKFTGSNRVHTNRN